MLEFVDLINYLESIGLHRENIDCKKYDYTGIQYRGDDVFSVSIDESLISENVSRIILYNTADVVRLVLLTPHLVKYNFNLRSISEVEIT